jgi:hypothetical protein
MILVSLGVRNVRNELVESYPDEWVTVNHDPMIQHQYRLDQDIAALASVETIKDLRVSGTLHK